MSIFSQLAGLISETASTLGNAFDSVVDRLRSLGGSETERRQFAFTAAMIALAAKMAKADGVVTGDEITAFRDLVEFPPHEAKNVARLYDLARQDVAGYQAYADKIARLFPDDTLFLEDVVDGLFHIAKADGVLHENEETFLRDVAQRFGFGEADYLRIRARHVRGGGGDPYAVLGADPSMSFAEIRRLYLKIVAETHPDRLTARGVPPEFIKIASERLAAVNAAFDMIEKAHRL
ncbi:MAG: DnaJ family molecular chaperone [Hyphomicrobiaceae bacterium]|nr:DnaJ family molecular chaperone [Hyphomicrobiaceae bacterium]